AVYAVQDQWQAEPATVHCGLDGLVPGVVAAHEADAHQPPPGVPLGVEDPRAALDGGRERLLAQDGLARRDAGEYELLVGRVGRGDEDRVHAPVPDQRMRVVEDRRAG